MSMIDAIRAHQDELTKIRRDLHSNPELGLEEHRTSEIVAKQLAEWGIEVHRNVGKTGVVGVLRRGSGGRAIGLRADMDCLPMEEQTNLAYSSRNPGRMHACGHDGHTTMLLAAAKYLVDHGDFEGTVNFIFQPGEEGIGGALAMLKDGLFERFPCDAIYALHNLPGMDIGKFSISPGPSAAGGAFFDLTVTGKGSHGAYPEQGIDTILVASHIHAALQSIVARNVPPSETAVLSVTRFNAGDAYNVLPQQAALAGTARAFSSATMKLLEDNMRRVAQNVASAFGAEATLDFRLIFAPLINDAQETTVIGDTAAAIVGETNVNRAEKPAMGSEDFSFMMERVPGAYIQVGNGDSASLHNPHYNFNDACTPYGAAVLAGVAERRLRQG
jgi:hippurate hydrolase